MQAKAKVKTSVLLNQLAEKLADARELDSEIRAIATELESRRELSGDLVGLNVEVSVMSTNGVLCCDPVALVDIEKELLAATVPVSVAA